ncbi:MAG: tRNA 2-thiocytidine biosynthesis TtcA family protein [Chlamydiales bacterium]|nr:tRNA 2-thiocytidine biosynthesis TtcA family protein [Chlamydiales bacterium]
MQSRIPQPPWPPLGRRLESTLRKALHDHAMLENVSKVAIALSGGKDSMTLLFLLKAISGHGFPPLDIHAIHVGGSFSCGAGVNVPYLQDVCSQLGVNFILREAFQDISTLECYSCSRERRRLLFQAAQEVGCNTIAFGHHRDDNAQTVLMNLFHKGSFEGMLPKITMHAYGVTILRPMIYIAEADVRKFAEQQGFARIMCRCPVGQNSMRKQVDDLLNDIEGMYPHVRSNVANAGLRLGTRKAEEMPERFREANKLNLI